MWTINKKTTKYTLGSVKLEELDVIDPNKNKKKRINLSLGGDSVLIIPIFKNSKIIIQKQARIGEKKEILEFPNGGINKGEKPIDAAKRELNEETGYEGKMVFLGIFKPLVGILKLTVHVFACKNIIKVKNRLNQDSYEKITTLKLTEKQIESCIKKGEIIDGYTTSAFMLYKLKK